MKKTLVKAFSVVSLAVSSIAYADLNTNFNLQAPQINAQTYILMDYNSEKY